MPTPDTTQATHDDEAAEARIYPDLPCYVANDAEFRAAVQKGMESARTGRLYTLEEVVAELHGIINGRG